MTRASFKTKVMKKKRYSYKSNITFGNKRIVNILYNEHVIYIIKHTNDYIIFCDYIIL